MVGGQWLVGVDCPPCAGRESPRKRQETGTLTACSSRPSTARVCVLSVKDFRVAGTGNCRMRRLLPTQAGDKPPRYIFSPLRGLRFFE